MKKTLNYDLRQANGDLSTSEQPMGSQT